jgi:hypothetical protein
VCKERSEVDEGRKLTTRLRSVSLGRDGARKRAAEDEDEHVEEDEAEEEDEEEKDDADEDEEDDDAQVQAKKSRRHVSEMVCTSSRRNV